MIRFCAVKLLHRRDPATPANATAMPSFVGIRHALPAAKACASLAVSALRRCRRRRFPRSSPTDAAHGLAFERDHRIDQLASRKLSLPIRFGTI
jgi:hypothetical protein